MSKPVAATRRQVLARMKRGDCPLRLDYNRVEFEDGTRVRFATIRGLEVDGLIERPTGTVIGDKFKLTDLGRKA
jgi:hypothetical protein